MADLGTALACLTSLPARWSFVSGKLNLAYALGRRLITPRGRLDYAPDYGTDMRDFLNHANTPQGKFAAQVAAAAECAKDERVLSVDVTADFLGGVLTLTIAGTSADGQFRHVFGVDQATVALVEAT